MLLLHGELKNLLMQDEERKALVCMTPKKDFVSGMSPSILVTTISSIGDFAGHPYNTTLGGVPVLPCDFVNWLVCRSCSRHG